MGSLRAEPSSFAPAELRKAWRIVSWAGLLGSIYFLLCITGAPRIKFLTQLGATPFDFGLMSGVGSFALIFQIAGSMLSNALGRRKPLWMFLAIMHRLVYLGAAFAPFLIVGERPRIWWIITIFAMHDILANTSAPIWLSWMADIVPHHSVNRHWAVRQRFITALNLIAMIFMAFGFDYFEKRGAVINGYILLAVIGVLFGVTDILMFSFVREPHHVIAEQDKWTTSLTQPLRDRSFRPFVYFMSFWNFSIWVSAPFFGLFLIEDLGYSVFTVQMLGIAGSIGVVLASRFWGLLCDTYGFRPILQFLAVGKATTPLMFMLAPRIPWIGIPWLVAMYVLDGAMNGGFVLATQGVLLKSTPRRNRSMYIAATNFFATGISTAIAPILAGALIDVTNRHLSMEWGPYKLDGYQVAFGLSLLLRIAVIPLARGIHDPGSATWTEVWRHLKAANALRVTRWAYRLHEAVDPRARLDAARTLGILGSPLAVGELIHSLHDGDHEVREASAEALGRIGEAEAAKPLGHALRDPELGIQSPAARALGRIGGAQSVRALITNLGSSDTDAMCEIVDSLAQIGDGAAIVPLMWMYHERDDERLRRRIAEALGKLSDSDSAEVIRLLRGRQAG